MGWGRRRGGPCFTVSYVCLLYPWISCLDPYLYHGSSLCVSYLVPWSCLWSIVLSVLCLLAFEVTDMTIKTQLCTCLIKQGNIVRSKQTT